MQKEVPVLLRCAIDKFRDFGRIALSLIWLGLAAAPSAYAQDNIPEGPIVQVSLVSERITASPGDSFWLGLNMDVLKGWHVYWRNAGDAGAPPKLTWHLPDGVSVSDINWPVPERMAEGPLMTFAYADNLLLPIKITLSDTVAPNQSLILKADARWLVCEKICIPEDGKVELILNVEEDRSEVDPVWAPRLSAEVAALPVPAPWTAGFAVAENILTLDIAAPLLGQALSQEASSHVTFFPYEENVISNPADQYVRADEEGFQLSVDLRRGGTAPDAISGILVFEQTLDTGVSKRAYEFKAVSGDAISAVASTDFKLGQFLQFLIFAFLGGIILNAMPCVFPVLFMKAFSFMKHADGSRAAIRKQGLWYTAGVIATFVSLALILIGLRASGAQIGWGFQLQSPLVIATLAFVMLAVGLSLAGVFSVGGSLMNVGGGLAEKEGWAGSFFTGVLATTVATPCTAPFMGAAVGFALTQPNLVSIAVFASLGLGMALPFLLLSFFPSLVQRLPKPGPWMDRAKQFLAFPMFGTGAWLVWVFALQAGQSNLLSLLIALVIFAFAVWAFGAAQGQQGKWALAGRIAAVLGLITVVILIAELKDIKIAAPPGGASSEQPEGGLAYVPFSPEALAELRLEGTPVFVNFTAAWCISCLVNEQVVFTQDAVIDAFEDNGVTYMKADWTNRDAVITKALAEYGRAGVPLYLYFAPGASEAEILPQILTEGIVINAISKSVSRVENRKLSRAA